MIRKFASYYKGALMVEIVITAAIVALIAAAFLGAASLFIRVNTGERSRDIAVNLAQEAIEAVKNFRDGTDWGTNGIGTKNIDTAYYPQKSGNPPAWNLVLGEEEIVQQGFKFKRKIIFSNVNRSSDDIVEPPAGSPDPDTKKITVTVSWENGAKKVEIVSYITNWR